MSLRIFKKASEPTTNWIKKKKKQWECKNVVLIMQYLHFWHIAYDTEDDEACDETGQAVDGTCDNGILNNDK